MPMTTLTPTETAVKTALFQTTLWKIGSQVRST